MIQDFLCRRLVFPLVRRRSSLNWPAILEGMHKRRALEEQGLQAVRREQRRRLKSLLVHAGSTVPYYRELFGDCGIEVEKADPYEVIDRIPPLTKSVVNSERERLLSSTVPASSRIPNASGGSTGMLTRFFMDGDYVLEREIQRYHVFSLYGWRPGCRIGYLWGASRDIPKETSGDLLFRLKLPMRASQFYDAFNLSPSSMVRHHKHLKQQRPHLLVGYAGALARYARYLSQSGKRVPYPSQAVISSAEALSDADRQSIRAAFLKPVFNFYGSRETGTIAFECPQGRRSLHVSSLTSYVTLQDAGHASAIQVTNLCNHAMPLIKYDMGDLTSGSGLTTCSCSSGAPSLADVVGRRSDFIILADGSAVHGEYFTHLFYDVPEIEQFKLVQLREDSFELHLVPSSGKVIDEAGIRDLLERTVGYPIRLRIVVATSIQPERSGKYRFTVSRLSDPFSTQANGGQAE